MRVVLVSHSPHMQGAERMVLNFARLFKGDQNIDVTVLVPSANHGKLAGELEREGITWYDIPSSQWFIQTETRDWNKFLAESYKRSCSLSDLILDLKADVVIVNTITSIDFTFAAVLSRTPVILWAHGLIESWWIDKDSEARRFCEEVLISVSQKVVCVSDHTAHYFESFLPFAHYRTIHNWTDIAGEVSTYRLDRRIACLATFESHKGVETVLRAAVILKERGLSVPIDLYGEDHDGAMAELINNYGLCNIVYVRPRTSDVDSVYKAAYAVVVPSFVESFGMVAIESMARGTAVIASDAGGLPEIFQHGVSGLLFKSGDASQLADRMAELIVDNALRERIGRAGYMRACEYFNGTKAKEAWIGTINETIENFRGYSHVAHVIVRFSELVSQSYSSSSLVLIKTPHRSIEPSRSIETTACSNQSSENVVEQLTELGIDEPVGQIGYVDGLVEGSYLRGWAFSSDLDGPCELDLYIDSKLIFRYFAREERFDLRSIGIRNVDRGFTILVPSHYLDGMEHEFVVKFCDTGVQLSQSPLVQQTKNLSAALDPEKSGAEFAISKFFKSKRSRKKNIYVIQVRGNILRKLIANVFRRH